MKGIISAYLQGNGIDVSKTHRFDNIPNCYKAPNGQYTLHDIYVPESLDFVYSQDLINSTKYYRTLLKEWFYLIKTYGVIIIEGKDNRILDSEQLTKEINQVFKKKAQILEIEKENHKFIVVIKKQCPALPETDNIDSWSFGILTDGRNRKQTEKALAAIRRQKVPNYEIIICGTYFGTEKSDISYIRFMNESYKELVTSQRNRICSVARYENILIISDDIILNEDWFEGMKRFGNYFDCLGCRQLTPEGIRAGDWCTGGGPIGTLWKIGLLDYADQDIYGYVSGNLLVIKKSVWEENKWNEELYTTQKYVPLSKWIAEDIEFCHRLTNNGFLIKVNTYSSCICLDWKWGQLPSYHKNTKKLGYRCGPPFLKLFIWTGLRFLVWLRLIDQFLKYWNQFTQKLSYFRHSLSIEIVHDFKGGSVEKTLLVRDDTAMRVRKTISKKNDTESGYRRLKLQYEWLINNYARLGPHIPEILSINEENGELYYEMPYYQDFVPFFQFIHKNDIEKSSSILKRILDFCFENMYIVKQQSEKKQLQKYVKIKMIDRVQSILQRNKEIWQLCQFDKIVINGTEHINFFPLLQTILNDESYVSLLTPQYENLIHGDLTIENILCKENDFILLDCNCENILNTWYLDIAKLYQSLDMHYEFLRTYDHFIHIERNCIFYNRIISKKYQILFDLLNNYNPIRNKQVILYFYEASHYVRMLPYKQLSNPQTTVLYYCIAVELLNRFYKNSEHGR